VNRKRLLAILLIVLELALLAALFKGYTVFRQGSCAGYLDFVQNFDALPKVKKYLPQVDITEGYTAYMLGKNINTLGAADYIVGANELYKSCQSGGNIFTNFYNLQKGGLKPTADQGEQIAKANPNLARVAHLISLNELLGFDKVMDKLNKTKTQPK
jgi:hypothetical protein